MSSSSTTTTTLSTTSSSSTISTTSTLSTSSSSSSTASTTSTLSTSSSTSSTASTTSSVSTTSTSSSTTTTGTTISPTKVYLDDFQLPDLTIVNEFGDTMVMSSFERALDGSPVVWEQEIISGKKIDLVGGIDYAWISREDLLDLKDLAEAVRTTYTFYYGGEARTVRFRNEEPPVISAQPIVPRVNPEITDWYHSLRIKLVVL